MPYSRAITIVIVLFGPLLWAIWDVVPATNAVSGDTISEVLRLWGLTFPIVPFTWAYMYGHFWTGIDVFGWSATQELKVSLWILWLGLILSLWFHYHDYALEWWEAWLIANLGIGAACIFWPQA